MQNNSPTIIDLCDSPPPTNRKRPAPEMATPQKRQRVPISITPNGIKSEVVDYSGVYTNGILGAWQAVVYADTEAQFYSGTGRRLNSLINKVNIRNEFAHHTIKEYRNFGIRITSRTEGAHGILKRLIETRRIDLHGLACAIEETLERLKENLTPPPPEFLALRNEEDPDRVVNRRWQTQPRQWGPQQLFREEAYTEEELQALFAEYPSADDDGNSTSTRCQPSHDAPPPKKKK
ncbi:hypothetical protein OQA88_13696 [Cercophora sp. LCS_1]